MQKAHEGQLYGDDDYYHHPLSVAKMAKTYDEAIVALLHDTIEDTWVTREYLLEEGFPLHVVEAIESITRNEGEKYKEFIVRAGKNPLGARVKYWDATRNLGRNHELPLERRGLAKRYRKAIQYLSPIVFGEVDLNYGD
jgi:hypothetical protein